MSSDPIAYTYEADYHCEGCTGRRFGYGTDGFPASERADGTMPTDNEGNEVGAVFPWDQVFDTCDWHKQTLVCGTCGCVLDEIEPNLDVLITVARSIGREHGNNAAQWYFDGNTDQNTYAATLKGICEGDPAVYETFPSSPLSGEWADSYLPQTLLADCGVEDSDLDDVDADELCRQYEDAYEVEVSYEIERQARAYLATGED